MTAADFFQLPPSLRAFAEFFRSDAYPWEWIRQVAPALEMERFVPRRSAIPEGFQMKGFAYIHSSVKFPSYGALEGPAWIGEGVALEPGVVLKGPVILGAGCTVGAGTVLENCLLLEAVRVSPRALIVDSVVGTGTFIGTGASLIPQRYEPTKFSKENVLGFASLDELGCVLGDLVEIGHHAVITPGSVLAPRTRISAGSVFSSPISR